MSDNICKRPYQGICNKQVVLPKTQIPMHPGQCFFIIEITQRMPSLFLSFEIKKLLGLEKYFLRGEPHMSMSPQCLLQAIQANLIMRFLLTCFCIHPASHELAKIQILSLPSFLSIVFLPWAPLPPSLSSPIFPDQPSTS